MEEQEGRVVEPHQVDAVVGPLDLAHLLQLVCLAMTNELHYHFEEVLIVVDFLHNFIEEERVLKID